MVVGALSWFDDSCRGVSVRSSRVCTGQDSCAKSIGKIIENGGCWSFFLEVNGLSVYHGSTRGEIKAVDDVDLVLDSKEIIGVAGESGSGKSTLALGMLRLLNPPGRIVGGEVLYHGVDLLKLKEEEFRDNYRWKKLAMVFQGSMNGFTPVFTIEIRSRRF